MRIGRVDMKTINPNMRLSRVEIVKKQYNEQGQIVQEEWQYFYPETKQDVVEGFKPSNKK